MSKLQKKIDILMKDIDELINQRSEIGSLSRKYRREYVRFIDYQNDEEYELYASNLQKSEELDEEFKKLSKILSKKFKQLDKVRDFFNEKKELFK